VIQLSKFDKGRQGGPAILSSVQRLTELSDDSAAGTCTPKQSQDDAWLATFFDHVVRGVKT